MELTIHDGIASFIDKNSNIIRFFVDDLKDGLSVSVNNSTYPYGKKLVKFDNNLDDINKIIKNYSINTTYFSSKGYNEYAYRVVFRIKTEASSFKYLIFDYKNRKPYSYHKRITFEKSDNFHNIKREVDIYLG